MKLRHLFEERQHSLAVEILLDKMAEGPVFFAALREGTLVFNEIHEVKSEPDMVFASGAGKRLEGKPYVSVNYRAPGYLSFHPDPKKRGIGDGWGNGTAPILDTDTDEPDLKFTKARIFKDQPVFDVIYTWDKIEDKIAEHSKRMEAAIASGKPRK